MIINQNKVVNSYGKPWPRISEKSQQRQLRHGLQSRTGQKEGPRREMNVRVSELAVLRR